jgi:hypothetical protein
LADELEGVRHRIAKAVVGYDAGLRAQTRESVLRTFSLRLTVVRLRRRVRDVAEERRLERIVEVESVEVPPVESECIAIDEPSTRGNAELATKTLGD